MYELVSALGEVLLYGLARLALPVLSLGRISVQSFGSRETGFDKFGIKRLPAGRLLVSRRVASLIGCALWLVAILGYVVVRAQ